MSEEFLIDGRAVPFTPGQSILQAAQAAGVYIPHLCHHSELGPHGSCRVCMVRAGGRVTAACAAPVHAGLAVENDTAELRALRRGVVQMLFVEGNHLCPGCEKSGACQLQAVAYQCGLLAPEFVHLYPQRPVDASHPQLALDRNRCILCGLCVRTSAQIDHKQVFSIGGRGLDASLRVDSPSGRLGDSTLSVTDAAAQVCPVGAILIKGTAYRVPLGQRRYDTATIAQHGNLDAGVEVAQ